MKPKHFQITTDDIRLSLLKGDVIEAFKVDASDISTLTDVYVIVLEDKALICRVQSKGESLSVFCDKGTFDIPLSQIKEMYKVDCLTSRRIE